MSTSSTSRAALLQRRLRGLATRADTGIARIDREGALPLSSAQRRLWVLDQMQPGGTEYLMPVRLRMRGTLDTGALQRALDDIVERHEVLRTRYRAVDGEPVQVVDPPAPLRWQYTDLSGDGPDAAERSLDHLAATAARRPFDLGADWPVRAVLARLADDEHVLLLTLHHIAADGWSESVLLGELDTLYTAHAAGAPSPLAPLPVQYADVAAWQAERLRGARLAAQLDHWRTTLAGLTPLRLPTDRPRPAVRDNTGDAESFTVPADLAADLVRLGREHRATPFMVLLAAFQLLLSRYCGQPDVVVGSPVAGRDHADTQGLIGLFVNMVALRTRVDRTASFAELLTQVRQSALAAYEHQSTPFERLVEELEPVRDPSRTPLFQVAFQLEDAPAPAATPARDAGLLVTREPVGWEVAKYDLSLSLAPRPDGTTAGKLEYATALFDRATARRMVGHYLHLLLSLVADPTRPVGRLRMLPDAERHQLLAQGGTGQDFPVRHTLPELFAEQVRRTPHAVAVTAADATLTYAELDERAGRLARHLRTLGAGPQTLVAVHLDRRAELVVALLGVLRAGAGYLPLDPGQPADRLRHILDDAGAAAVVTHRDLLGHLPGLDVPVALVDDADPPGAGTPLPPGRPDDTAYVIYTSGSTGRPKGVPVSHANVVRLFASCAEEFRFGADDVWTLFHSYAFDFSVWELWGPLLHGGRLVVVPYEVSRSPQDFLDLLVRERVSVLNQTPSAFRALAEAVGERDVAPGALALRTVVFGGEALDVADLAPWFARFGDTGPELVNMYGITETTVHVTYRPIRARDSAGASRSPIGRPLRDLRVYLLDDDLNPVPPGVPGQIFVAGAGVARGYLGRPALTADRFGPDPFAPDPGGRMYRTGDLARWSADGELEFIGRADDQIKIRGHRIEPGEVEAALRARPGIDAAVVVAHRGPGDPEDRLVAYVVPAGGHAVDVPALREQLGTVLPAYMVPAIFVPLDAVPVTANGKVDRAALPDPGTRRGPDATARVAARTPVEQAMAQAWSAALGVDAVGVHDNFFVLGGDSIRAIRVIGALRRQGLDVTVQDLLLHQTIDSLGRRVASTPGSAPAGAEESRIAPFALLGDADRAALPPDVVDAYPLSMVQAAMVYQMLADVDDSPYHNITLFPMVDDAPFSLPALRRAAALLAERHEILRTSIRLEGYTEPLQLVHATGSVPVGYDDLRGHDDEQIAQALREFGAQARRNPLDIGRAPLLRFHVHQTAPDRWTFSFIECHAILDGWSHHSLIAELLDDYHAIRAGREPQPRPGHSVRYADFVALEKRSLASPDDQRFWADRLGRFDPVALPTGWAAEPGAGERPYKIGLSFADLEPGLRRLAATAGVPLKSVLFGAHLTVLRALSGSRRFHSGLVCNGRLETEGGETVRGMHLNTLPVGVDLTGATWTDLVRQVFAEEVAIWPHRRFPLPELQRRFGEGTPLTEVAFTYLDFHVLSGDGIDSANVVDVSPNEFALDTWTFPGALFFTARPERVSRANGRRLARMYRRVLEAMAADPAGSTVGAALDAEQLDELTRFATGPQVDQPDLCVHEMFAEQAARTPDAVALRCADGRTVSYADLDARANRLAHHLRDLGAGPEHRVGLLLRRGPDLITALLGVHKAGAAYLPVDPNHPADRIRTLLEQARVSLAVTESALADRLDGASLRTVEVDTDTAVARRPATEPPRTASPDALAYIIYTSGSTGVPKGVMIEHRNLANYVRWAIGAYTPRGGTGAALYSSVAFDLPMTTIYPTLLTGQPLTLTPDDGTPGVDGLLDAMRTGGFGLLKATPTHVAIVNGSLAPHEIRRVTGRVVAGGDKLTREMVSAFAQHAPDTLIDNEYGPTETTVGCSWLESTPDTLPAGVLPIGQPIDNTVMRVLDADLCPVPVGTGGELYIGGAQVARGYVERPELTAEKFVPDPYSPQPGARLYRTGDLARCRADGTLEFLGRADHQVKIRGYRIELGEVEAALRRHADLRDVAVRVHTRPDGERELIGYVVPTGEFDPAAVAERMSRTMPDYLVPSGYVVLDALPMTPSGKIDTRALPAPQAPSGTRPYEAPRTAMEAILAGTLACVLKLPRVGIDESFTALGVHSMTVMRLVMDLRDNHGLGVTFRDFYQHRTVRDLARAVDPGLHEGLRPVAAANPDDPEEWAADALLWFRPEGELPPLFCVYPGGSQWYVHLAEYMEPGRPVAGLEWPGLHRSHVPPPQSIGQLADVFLRQIRAARPTGPYHLLGWCGSGPVTGEMAARLLRQGEYVTYTLLDPSQDSHTRQTLWEACAAFAEGEDLLVELNQATDPQHIADLQRRFVAVLERVIDEGTKEPPQPGDTFWPVRLKVWRELHQATLGHRQRPYPGQLNLLVGDELAEGLHVVAWGQSFEQYRQRWADLTPGGLCVQRVGGDHLGVLKPPHVANLAGTLVELMRQTEHAAAQAARQPAP